MYGRDASYASSRLDETVVTLNGRPVIVNGVDPACKVYCVDVMTGKDSVCDLDELCLTPVKVGFVNFRGEAYYIVRKPMRRDWRQGLRLANVTCLNKEFPRGLGLSDIGHSIINDYPTLADVVKTLRSTEDVHSIAWCREFALGKKGQLFHSDSMVGYYNFGTGEFTLKEEYDYLKESLGENL